MRVIIFINTYYQLITAMQMKSTLLKKDFVTAVVTDRANDISASSVVNRLICEQFFDETVFCEAKNSLHNRTKKDKCCEIIDIAFKKKNRYKFYLEDLESKIYDLMIFYNYDIDMYGVFSMLSYINTEINVALFEEGVLSYDNILYDSIKYKVVRMLRTIVGKKNIIERIIGFYCFYPELYIGKLNVIKIPKIDDFLHMGRILRRVFKVDSQMLKINEKYIFFTSVFDFEGGEPIGEYELVSKISDIVGKENLIIKTHPRDIRTIYIENGFKVYKNSSIPWEAIQLNNDFSEKCFLTVNSGSILGGNLMLQKRAKSFFLYKCCDLSKNPVAISTSNDIESFLMNSHVKDIEIVENISALEKILSVNL